MSYNHSRSSSSALISRSQQDHDNILLEPLLPSLQISTDDLCVSEKQQQQEPRNDRRVCSMYVSRLKKLRCLMALRSSRTCCFDTLKWIPVLFILAVVAWSYYAFVVEMCIFTIDSVPKKVIYLCLYHPLLFLFLWSYYQTMFKPLLGPTPDFYIGEAEAERVASAQTLDERRAILVRLCRRANLPVMTRHFDGSIRYCFTCKCIKPDRAHHCSVCGQCVLRYDHHCPWTNSCVSFVNYKFFILFLGWALIFCIFVAATSLEYFIRFWQGIAAGQKDPNVPTPSSTKFHLLFLFFGAIMFAISVSSLFFYHLYLTAKNRTTLESFRAPIFADGPQKDGFNLGCRQNYQEIFGMNFLHALIPVTTSRGDGIHYQINSVVLGGLQQQPIMGSNGANNEHNNSSVLSPFSRSSDVLLPLDSTSHSASSDQNYLLTGTNNNR